MTNDHFFLLWLIILIAHMICLHRLIYKKCHHSFKLDMTTIDSKLALLKTSLMYFYMSDSLLNVSAMNELYQEDKHQYLLY